MELESVARILFMSLHGSVRFGPVRKRNDFRFETSGIFFSASPFVELESGARILIMS